MAFDEHLADRIRELIAGAVFGNRELIFFLREHRVGDEVEAVWAHEGTLRRGTGRLTQRDMEIFAHHA